jgi:hypothetical protein
MLRKQAENWKYTLEVPFNIHNQYITQRPSWRSSHGLNGRIGWRDRAVALTSAIKLGQRIVVNRGVKLGSFRIYVEV